VDRPKGVYRQRTVWWILSGLLILIAWTLKIVFQAALPLWIPIVATVVIGGVSLTLFLLQRVRAARAAKALERAIGVQGEQQAQSARPDLRPQIQELQKQVQGGINALKASKLGKGRRSGAAALYSLPWYVIIGPPGAGKTTALKHSGLVFPFQAAGGAGSVRGVGGTRNCDWWFTNEAILLDTAGRYATESDDREEWLAFLQMLRKYRSRRPINGVLVAISVAELLDANEQQIDSMGKKIRARIDEVMTHLQMVVPVYVLFTKCDLIAGFDEFFGDLRRGDRAVPWGATLRLDLNKTDPARIFDAEFDVLARQLHGRALKRLAFERSREVRERVFQFPLEFSGMKRNLAELVGTIFQVNAFQGTPLLRGFYFTSGTQEGRPLDRVLGKMSHAMGIRPSPAAAPRVVEAKSYFLHDVFMNVVFPDGDIAARTEGERRRQLLMRVAISAAAVTLATILAIPGVASYANNRAFLRETEERARVAAAIDWSDGRPAPEKLVLLDPLLQRLEEIDDHKANGIPLGMGWRMYRGEDVYKPAALAYASVMQKGMVTACKYRLEDKIKRIKGEAFTRERLDLKTYLMMSSAEHLQEDLEWETGKLTAIWAEILRSTSNISEGELKEKLRPHVRYYLKLVTAKLAPTSPLNGELVDKARKALQSVPVERRYYELFVNSLIEQKYDEAGESVLANRKYPPVTLGVIFVDRADVLKVVTSTQLQKGKGFKEVEGPYTEKGHYAVLKNIREGSGLLERDQWVVPLTADEGRDRIPQNLQRLAEEYESRYIEQWTTWMEDITVPSPATVRDAIQLYTVLGQTEWPYVRILRRVQDDTQWNKPPELLEKSEVTSQINTALNQKATQATGGLRFGIDVKKMGVGDRVSSVPSVFKRTVEFGISVAAGGGQGGSTALAKYNESLDLLKQEMQKADDITPGATDPKAFSEQLARLSAQADALLLPFDEKAKHLLKPLLQSPLKIVPAPLATPPGAAAGRPSGGVRLPPRQR
jgi:type VI secretion system protein ImpL